MFNSPKGVVAGFLAVVIAAGTVGIMTQPLPQNSEQNLAQTIQEVPISPVVMRVGVVTNLVESDNITVQISGSDVLVTASYLFPQYLPMLGDRVVVYRQDAQWFVLGTMSGPINTLVVNPSFEDGPIGFTPPGWTIIVTATGGGTPTFTAVAAGSNAISGLQSGDFGVDATVAGNSLADIFSDPIAAPPGSKWTAGIWVESAFVDNDVFTFANNGGFSQMDIFLVFSDSIGNVLQTTEVNYLSLSIDLNNPRYVRPRPGSPAIEAPPDSAYVQMKIHGDFTMSANSFTSFFIDYAIVRRVG